MKNKLKNALVLSSKVLLILTLCVLQREMLVAQTAQPNTLEEALNPDGTLREGVSGSFSGSGYRMSTNASGEPTFTPIAQSTPNTWDTELGAEYNGMSSRVAAIETDGNGTWYFAGDFTQAGGLSANRVVKYNAITNALSTLGTGTNNGVNGRVNAIKLLSGFLYVAGDFTTAGGITANRIARYNPTTDQWSAVGSGVGNGVNDEVFALSATGVNLYVGGKFTQVNVGTAPVAANSIARWNGTVWTSLGTGANNGVSGSSAIVNAVASTTTNVFVGGLFNSAGTTSSPFIARFQINDNTWHALGAGTDAQVFTLTASGSDVYASGFFTQAGGNPANRIARWNGTAWSALGAGLDQPATQIVVSGTQVYVGGIFTQAGTISANRVARWNGSTWVALANGVNSNVGDIRLAGDTLYVGGLFTTANGNPASRIARYRISTATWSAVRFENGVNGIVRAISVLGDNVYLGGSFTVAGGVEANRVVRYNLLSRTWLPLRKGISNGVNNDVNAIVAFPLLGDAVYVGGSFTEAGGITANRIARWFNNDWTIVGNNGGNGVDAVVTSLAYRSQTLYVGGSFAVANLGSSSALVANRFARVNTSANAWSAVGSGGNGFNNTVRAIWISESGDVYVGGEFTTANVGTSLITANRVARWDGNSWSSLGTGTSNGTNGTVFAITGSGTDVYIGGVFSNAGGVANTRACARWSTSKGRWIGMGNTPGLQVNALAVSGSYVFAGGTFTQIGSNPANRLARWNGVSWTTVGTTGGNGTNAEIRALATRSVKELLIGGDFVQVNVGSPIDMNRIARWTADTSAFVTGPNLRLNYTNPNTITPTISFTNSAPTPSTLPTGISGISQYYWTIPNTAVFTQGFLETDILQLAGVTGNPGALRFLWRLNASAAWTNLGPGFANGAGNLLVSQTPISSGGQIAIGDAGGGNQLPVELTNFGASLHKEGVILKWTTATELNNSGFYIERRRKQSDATQNAPSWISLDFVKGNGTTSSQNSYSFVDKSASGMVEYRLKQVDFDGKFEYSPIVEINAGLPKNFDLWQNYPNPFNPTTVIRYQLPTASTVRLELYDMLGKKLATLVNEQQEAGSFEYQLDAAKLNLSSGVYFYRLQAGAGASGASSFVQTKKMMLVK